MNPILDAINFLEANIHMLVEFYPEQQIRRQIEDAKRDLDFNLEQGYNPYVALSFSSARDHIPNVTLTYGTDRNSNDLKFRANFSTCSCSSMGQIQEISRLTNILGVLQTF
jgi:hypothetical protein